MKSLSWHTLLIIIVAALFSGCAAVKKQASSAAPAGKSELVSSLTEKLGVSGEQASGGAGAIFAYAKQKLSPENFSTVSKSLPEVDSLVKAAPKEDSMTGKLGNMTSALSGGSDSAGGLGALAGSFGKLGLSPDMVGKFLPIVLQYANTKGGSGVAGLLQGVLK